MPVLSWSSTNQNNQKGSSGAEGGGRAAGQPPGPQRFGGRWHVSVLIHHPVPPGHPNCSLLLNHDTQVYLQGWRHNGEVTTQGWR